jgi:predicted nuclease of predicted toxin-antitoxin system
MKFLLDENADIRIAPFLAERGHDVRSFTLENRPGSPDREVLAVAEREQRILITNDLDFGELVFRHAIPHAGVILFRLHSIELSAKLYWLDRILNEHRDRLHEFLVVSERGVRIRRRRIS